MNDDYIITLAIDLAVSVWFETVMTYGNARVTVRLDTV